MGNPILFNQSFLETCLGFLQLFAVANSFALKIRDLQCMRQLNEEYLLDTELLGYLNLTV